VVVLAVWVVAVLEPISQPLQLLLQEPQILVVAAAAAAANLAALVLLFFQYQHHDTQAQPQAHQQSQQAVQTQF
jgi:hypothetical protein